MRQILLHSRFIREQSVVEGRKRKLTLILNIVRLLTIVASRRVVSLVPSMKRGSFVKLWEDGTPKRDLVFDADKSVQEKTGIKSSRSVSQFLRIFSHKITTAPAYFTR